MKEAQTLQRERTFEPHSVEMSCETTMLRGVPKLRDAREGPNNLSNKQNYYVPVKS